MISNQRGMVLPWVLALSLITASLLITLSNRLESQVHSYEQRQHFQKVTLLEKECIELLLEQLVDPNFSLDGYNSEGTLTLKNGTLVTLKYSNGIGTLVITYKFSYNSYLGSGKISYNKQKHTYTLE